MRKNPALGAGNISRTSSSIFENKMWKLTNNIEINSILF
jgi:hypothetical protein